MNNVRRSPRLSRKGFFPVAAILNELAHGKPMVNEKGNLNTFTPLVNIIETKNDFRIEMIIPGWSKKEIDVQLEKDQLTIRGEREFVKKEGETFLRKEFDLSRFSRSFQIPDSVNLAEVKANFKNGILIINLAKKEESKELPARKIEIV